MHRSISCFCLLSLWGLGSGMQAELGAVELHAREEAGSPFGVEVRAPEVNTLARTLWGAWPAFAQDDAVQRAESLLPDPTGADSSSYGPRVFYVPPKADSSPRTLFGPLPPEPLLRPIPTSWPPDVFKPIPTTWDAEIVLVEDGLGIGPPLQAAWPPTQPDHGSGSVGRAEW
jgi:hypothetical protein